MADAGTVDTPVPARMTKFAAVPRFTIPGPKANTPLEMDYIARQTDIWRLAEVIPRDRIRAWG